MRHTCSGSGPVYSHRAEKKNRDQNRTLGEIVGREELYLGIVRKSWSEGPKLWVDQYSVVDQADGPIREIIGPMFGCKFGRIRSRHPHKVAERIIRRLGWSGYLT